jgi:hypothetical protein
LRGVFTAPATNTSQRIARLQQRVQDAGWPQRRATTVNSPYSMGWASAIHTTIPEDASPKGNASKDNTYAAPVAPPATAHTPARPKPPWGVKETPLRLDRWHYFLDRLDKGHLTKPHLHVLEGINLIAHAKLSEKPVFNNLLSALAAHQRRPSLPLHT